MKVFDMHADMGTNFYERHLNGEKDVFKNYNKRNLEKGEVKGIFTACFFEGKEDWDYMQKMIVFCDQEIRENSDVLRQVKTKEDLIDDDKTLAVISVEGMCGIRDNAEEKIGWMYEHGVRVASLVWNESNALANGWKQDPLRGLSEEGFKAVKKMNELKMVIDVSHINEKGFWDVISASERPIIATHSNCRKLCSHQRNLTDQQIKAIAARGGLIGLNACAHFISEDKDRQTALELAGHARYMADLVGVEHIACGFDYMDFLIGDYSDDMAKDMTNASFTQNLISSLKEVGFSEEETAMIAFGNVFGFLKKEL
ncbi:MAG: membrane dipeptidase [Erysipelotrichaceae bacterium]|nr:membrane dipeptidase [Erysipelotrichaceae bacterium]